MMKAKHLLVVIFALVTAYATHAQTMPHVQSLQAVTKQIRVGKMTVGLPEGEWRLLNTREDRANNTIGSAVGGEIEVKYLVSVDKNNQFLGSVLISAPKNSSTTTGWNDSTCDRNDFIWVRKTDGSFNFPACFIIYNAYSFWTTAPTNEFELNIFNWLRSNKVQLPKTALIVVYRKYFSGDYIRVAYSINPEALGFAPDSGTTSGNSNWHPGLIKEDADKVKYIDALKKWTGSIEPHHRASLLKGPPGVESLPSWPEK